MAAANISNTLAVKVVDGVVNIPYEVAMKSHIISELMAVKQEFDGTTTGTIPLPNEPYFNTKSLEQVINWHTVNFNRINAMPEAKTTEEIAARRKETITPEDIKFLDQFPKEVILDLIKITDYMNYPEMKMVLLKYISRPMIGKTPAQVAEMIGIPEEPASEAETHFVESERVWASAQS